MRKTAVMIALFAIPLASLCIPAWAEDCTNNVCIFGYPCCCDDGRYFGCFPEDGIECYKACSHSSYAFASTAAQKGTPFSMTSDQATPADIDFLSMGNMPHCVK
jgi:hypothetical protein